MDMDTPSQIFQAVSFLDTMATSLIMPQIPPHAARSLGFSHFLVGLMMSLYPAFQLISGPVSKTLGESVGNKTLLVITLSVCGLAYVLLGITSSIFLFMVLRAVLGFFKQTEMLTKKLAPVYEADKKKVPDVIQGMTLGSGVGMVAGPIIGGHIMGIIPNFGFTFIAFLVGGIYATISYLIRKLPEEKETEKKKEETDKTTEESAKDSEETAKKSEESAKKSQEIALVPKLIESVTTSFNSSLEQFHKIDLNKYSEVLLLRALMILSTGIYFSNFALYLRFKHQASAENLGYVISIFSISGILFGRFGMKHVKEYYKDDKDYSARVYHVFLTMTLTFLAMSLVPSITMYVVCLVSFIACNIVGRSFTAELISSSVNENEKEVYSGVSNSIMNVGGVVAPVIAGILGQIIGILNIIYVLVLVAGVGAYRSHKMVPEVVIKTRSAKSKKQ